MENIIKTYLNTFPENYNPVKIRRYAVLLSFVYQVSTTDAVITAWLWKQPLIL